MPKEIEELVAQVPGVSQAFAIGMPDERWGEAGCVWIVPETGATVDPDAVLVLCREKLARFKVPKHVVVLRTRRTADHHHRQGAEVPHGADGSGATPRLMNPAVDYRSLVQPTRVHGSLYTDPAIFADELERIWYRELGLSWP